MMNDNRPAPLQFSLRAMMIVTAVFCLLFGSLKWLGVPVRANLIVLAVLLVSVIAAVGLLVVIANSITGERENDER